MSDAINNYDGFRIYQHRFTTVAGQVPMQLMPGEVAINLADGKKWFGDVNGQPVSFSDGEVSIAAYQAAHDAWLLQLPTDDGGLNGTYYNNGGIGQKIQRDA